MSGRSQARKSQRELQNVFTAGRGGADQRLPAAPRSIALPAPPPAPEGLPMAERVVGGTANAPAPQATTSEDVAVPGAGWANGARQVQSTLDGGTVGDNPECSCKCLPARLDRKNVKLGCMHITPLKTVDCPKCNNSSSKKPHSIGCDKSIYFGLTHGEIASKKGGKDPFKGKITKKDAKGTAPLSFFKKPPNPSSAPVAPPAQPPAPAAPAPATGMLNRLREAAVALVRPSSTKRDASTAIGDDTVGEEDTADRPRPSLAEETASLEAEDDATPRLIPELEKIIHTTIEKCPRVRYDDKERHFNVFQYGESLSADEQHERFAPGDFKVVFYETIDTGAETRPSYIKHALRGVEVIFLRPDLNRHGDEEVADSLRCFGCRGRLQFSRWTYSKRKTCKMILTTGRPHFLVEGSYQCIGCKQIYGASQYEMRVMQPPRIQSDLPVDTASTVCLLVHRVDRDTVEAIVCTHHDSLPYRSASRTPRRVWAGYWAKISRTPSTRTSSLTKDARRSWIGRRRSCGSSTIDTCSTTSTPFGATA